jgi:hypothetical protein
MADTASAVSALGFESSEKFDQALAAESQHNDRLLAAGVTSAASHEAIGLMLQTAARAKEAGDHALAVSRSPTARAALTNRSRS